ncbi:MAG: long-chain fatty acid--CoA ligase [Candidatus Dormibacteraeota bacterium]|nr:long-chain fatty acid--CoA ligase [Candidatus Dormibacteraeota bacterium]
MQPAVRSHEPGSDDVLALPQTVPALFQQTAKRRADAPALFFKAGGRWVPISWTEYARAVARLANALIAEGVASQDRVAVWSGNRPQWQIADLGILHAGAVTVAVYQTLAPDQVRYLLDHSEAAVLIVEERKLFDQIADMRRDLKHLRRVILMDGEPPGSDGWVVKWDEALRRGDDSGRTRPGLLTARWQAVQLDDMASLIYTSGTTGTPKAAILTHRNLTWTTEATMVCFPGTAEDRVLSYLPLAHVLERVVSHLRQLRTGCQVYFCPSVDQVMTMVHEVRPTYFTSVPRLWEKIYGGIRGRMDKVTGPQRVIRDWALTIGALRTAAYDRRRKPSPWVAWQWGLADRIVFRKIREKIGLDQASICISGSAPVSPEMLRFFYGLGIEILEGYGLTETTAPASFNRPGEARFGTVGPALPGVELRIASDGEILVKGNNVFAGYFKDPKSTAESLQAGWLSTGDVGELDADGFLKITDRKKDLFKTSGGKYVAPGSMENILRARRGIGQAVVLGDGRPFVAALFTLDPDSPEGKAGPDDTGVKRLVEEAVADVNRGLSHPEQIKKWTILDGDFVVGDELTPSMKVKRKRINEKYRTEIEALYGEKKAPSADS